MCVFLTEWRGCMYVFVRDEGLCAYSRGDGGDVCAYSERMEGYVRIP